MLFIEVPEAKTVKNRLHLDLVPTGGRTREEEVGRLLDLGATPVADLRTPDGRGWVTLADPEGNELCVLRTDFSWPVPDLEHLGGRAATDG